MPLLFSLVGPRKRLSVRSCVRRRRALSFAYWPGGIKRSFLRWVLFFLVAFYGACTLALLSVRFFSPPSTSVQLQRQFEALFTSSPYTEQYTFVPLRRIDTHLIHAVAENGRVRLVCG